jgi:hypothetical protein
VEQIIRIGMDTSKHIFQLHGVNAAEEPVLRRKLRRKDMVAFFAKLEPVEIAIEACGASHHWARRRCQTNAAVSPGADNSASLGECRANLEPCRPPPFAGSTRHRK